MPRLNARHFGGTLAPADLRLSARMRRRLGEFRPALGPDARPEIAISRRHLRRDRWRPDGRDPASRDGASVAGGDRPATGSRARFPAQVRLARHRRPCDISLRGCPGAQAPDDSTMPLETQSALKLWVVLSRAHASISAHAVAHAADHGLSLTEFAILEALYHRGRMVLGEIQRRILVSSGGITFLVDRLAEKGLVVRQECPEDRRAKYVSLTREGTRLIRELSPPTPGPSRTRCGRSRPSSRRPPVCSVAGSGRGRRGRPPPVSGALPANENGKRPRRDPLEAACPRR